MITDQLLNAIYYFLYSILGTIPSGHLAPGITDSITTMGGYLKYIKLWFPVDTLLEIIGLILAIETTLLGYYFVMWVIHRIPGE